MDHHGIEQEVTLDFSAIGISIKGILGLPLNMKGVVLFAHGSGSGRFSPRNNAVAHDLQKVGLGTLLMDLLTESEADDRRMVFNIDLLAERLDLAKDWMIKNLAGTQAKIGYFGASTGAGAALQAAAINPDALFAVVSRGGRPDLAGLYLQQVKAPTLLIVGGNDGGVIDLNHNAYAELNCIKELQIVPNATHLFEEPGTLEKVSKLAGDWFVKHI